MAGDLDVSLAYLARHIANTLGYNSKVVFYICEPGGALRNWMDSSRFNYLGLTPQIHLEQGLANVYQDFVI